MLRDIARAVDVGLRGIRASFLYDSLFECMSYFSRELLTKVARLPTISSQHLAISIWIVRKLNLRKRCT